MSLGWCHDNVNSWAIGWGGSRYSLCQKWYAVGLYGCYLASEKEFVLLLLAVPSVNFVDSVFSRVFFLFLSLCPKQNEPSFCWVKIHPLVYFKGNSKFRLYSPAPIDSLRFPDFKISFHGVLSHTFKTFSSLGRIDHSAPVRLFYTNEHRWIRSGYLVTNCVIISKNKS